MDAEFWALIGVIVGAVLGGVVQIVASWLTDHRAHQKWIREQRLEAYQSLLLSVDDLLFKIQQADHYGDQGFGPISEIFES